MVLNLALLMLISGVYADIPITRNLDPDYIPETREDYLEGRPPFQPLRVTPLGGDIRGIQFLVVLSETMAEGIEPGLLEQWLFDIEAQGLTAEAVAITWSAPEEIRAWFYDLYLEGLEGAVLVGDIPTAWAALEDLDGGRANETFPVDYFYWDLDGEWHDDWTGYPGNGVPGPDGIYDGWSGNLYPEIYVGRILTSVILFGDEVDLVNDYLERLHQWRQEGDPDPRALCYVDDDWVWWAESWSNAMTALYQNVELVSHPDSTNGTDYRHNRLQAGYTWISPFVHSGPTIHQWSPGPSTTSGHIWTDQPPSRFYNLFACSNARFTSNWCMGCVYVFGSQYGLAAVGSTKSGAMLQFAHFYSPLGYGLSFGEAMFFWWEHIQDGGFTHSEKYWHLGMTLLGDPTIIPAMHMLGVEGASGPPPVISISPNPSPGFTRITGNGGISVYDLTGRTVATGMNSLELSGLSSGVYLVRIRDGAASATGRFTVLR